MFDGTTYTYQKLAWYEITPFQLGLLACFVLVFLSGCIVWPVEHLIRHLRQGIRRNRNSSVSQREKQPTFCRTRTMRRVRCLARLISALHLEGVESPILLKREFPCVLRYYDCK